MPAASPTPEPALQPRPLPVTLNLELPAAPAAQLPMFTIPCRVPGANGSEGTDGRPAPLSWQELLGER